MPTSVSCVQVALFGRPAPGNAQTSSPASKQLSTAVPQAVGSLQRQPRQRPAQLDVTHA